MLKYYRHYFKTLATNDPAIAHTDAKPAYYFIRDRFSPDAFDLAIKNAGKTPALLLEPYTYDTKKNTNNYFKHLQGRFNILIKTEIGKESSLEAAEEQAEAIADNLLAKMREDFEGGRVIQFAAGDVSKKIFFELEATVDPIGPISQQYYGVSVGFEMRTQTKGTSS